MRVQALKPFASRGHEYLPGAVDVPERDVERLVAGGFIAAPDGEGAETGSAPFGDDDLLAELTLLREENARLRAAFEANQDSSFASPSTDFLVTVREHVGDAVANALQAAGITNAATLAATSDADLDALPGIGPATVDRLRELLAE